MIDYPALCKEIERTDARCRRVAIQQTAARIFGSFEEQGIAPGATDALAALIVGCACEGGRISEREYLYMYPALASAFGCGYDFSTVKGAFHGLVSSQKFVHKEAAEIAEAAKKAGDGTAREILRLCLLVSAADDGRIPLRAKTYFRFQFAPYVS